MVQLGAKTYPIQLVLMAINNVAAQIEYYFSDENLSKDSYLLSKMSQDGFAPLSLIGQFYRLVNMSFRADPVIILAALREIVRNESATVEIVRGTSNVSYLAFKDMKKSTEEAESEVEETKENPLNPFFIRSKNWSNWIAIPENAEKFQKAQNEAQAEQKVTIDVESVLSGDVLDNFMINIIPVPIPSRVAVPVATTEIAAEQPVAEQQESEVTTSST